MKKILQITLLLLISLYVDGQIFKSPDTAFLKSEFKKLPEHPRLILTPDRVSEIKTMLETDTLLQKLVDQVQFYADSALNAPLVEYKFDEPGSPNLKVQRRHGMFRVFNCGMMYQLTNDTVYAARVRDELLAAAVFPDWGNIKFLNVGEMATMVGIGYDWVYDYLKEHEKEIIIKGIVKNSLQEGLLAYAGKHKSGWWIHSVNNWNQVCNGGLALSAMAIAEDKPDTAAMIISDALHYITNAMTGYVPDGAWYEGPTYWAYGTTYNGMLFSALETSADTLYGLQNAEGYDDLGESGSFHIHTAGPTGLYYNFGDSKSTLYFSPVLFWMSHHYNNPAYAWFERVLINKDLPRMQDGKLMFDDTLDRFLALLVAWYNDAGQELTYDDVPLDKVFTGDNSAVGAFHSDWTEEAIYLGFKGGKPSANHAHMDVGSFVLDAEGERWAIDLGTDDYDLPGYFDRDGKRWDYYRLNNFGHNTLVINDDIQLYNAAANIDKFYSDTDSAYARVDMTSAYPYAASIERAFSMCDRKKVNIKDQIKIGYMTTNVRWGMLTKAEIELNRNEALLRQNGKVLKAVILQPKDAVFETISTDPNDDRQKQNEGTIMLGIHHEMEAGKDFVYEVELIPNDSTLSIISEATFAQSETISIDFYPNPFSKQLQLKLSVEDNTPVHISMFDLTGRNIATLINKKFSKGMYRFEWTISELSENEIPDGLYIIKSKIGDNTSVQKIFKTN